MAEHVYHLELRQFPHNMCRFNLPPQELRTIVLEAWVQERWVELGERKWHPQQATLTVLEGPRIATSQLTMGRGWRRAQRQGRDVTAQLLASVRRDLAQAAGRLASPQALPAAGGGHADSTGGLADPLADSLGLELLSRIGSERAPLRRAWELAAERHSDSAPSATLALAERAVESLLRAHLIVLHQRLAADAAGVASRPVAEGEIGPLLAASESWSAGEAGGIWMQKV